MEKFYVGGIESQEISNLFLSSTIFISSRMTNATLKGDMSNTERKNERKKEEETSARSLMGVQHDLFSRL